MIEEKQKSVCFILDHKLMSYRVPFFKQLYENGISVTICHIGSHKVIKSSDAIKEILLKEKRIFKFEYRTLPKLSNYDIVVHMQNLRILNFWLLTLSPFRKYKLIHWGIGVSSAKGLFLKKNIISRMRNFLASFASAQMLYSEFPLPLFSKKVKQKTFIAHNTVYNPEFQDYSGHKKNSFLFIGSLNKRKGLEDLLGAFAKMGKKSGRELKLIIIGDGEEKERLKKLSVSLQINDIVEFKGRINDQEIKEGYFASAIASVSPKQAGLSVLESFSYGIPFICYKNAISGGEHLNIVDNKNGFLVESQEELSRVLLNLEGNRRLARELGHNAYLFYKERRQMKDMVNSFRKAFEYVLKN